MVKGSGSAGPAGGIGSSDIAAPAILDFHCMAAATSVSMASDR